MLRIMALLVLIIVLAGCSVEEAVPKTNQVAQYNVGGTITFKQDGELQAGAAIRVQLVDVSRADAPAILLGEQIIEVDGRLPPFSFVIPYDPMRIDPRNSYAVQARVEDDGKLYFINDSHYGVITRGAPTHVTLMLEPVME